VRESTILSKGRRGEGEVLNERTGMYRLGVNTRGGTGSDKTSRQQRRRQLLKVTIQNRDVLDDLRRRTRWKGGTTNMRRCEVEERGERRGEERK
jgi:hypothetical protein